MIKILAFVLLIAAGCMGKSDYKDDYQWYKGNTHTHTTVSDGDASPREVISWYHDHGYNFLLISDHNIYLKTDTIPLPKNHRKDFILIPGEEITDKRYIHTTAVNCSGYVPFSGDEEYSKFPGIANLSVSQIIQLHIDGIGKRGGIAILNHPNYKSGAQLDDILKVKGLTHFEIYNGNVSVRTFGQEGEHISAEAKWDSLLSKGYLLYGVASDDAHNFKEFSKNQSNPGHGWIMVHSNSLVPDSIAGAVRKGDFYSTMGVIISVSQIEDTEWKIKVNEEQTIMEIGRSNTAPRIDQTGTPGFTIDYIGTNGKNLFSVSGAKASFKIPMNEKYVRARITYCTKSSEGYEKRFAWLQPYLIDKAFFGFGNSNQSSLK